MKVSVIILFVMLNTGIVAQQSNLDIIKEYYNSIEKCHEIEKLYDKYLQFYKKTDDHLRSIGILPDTQQRKINIKKIRNDNSIVFFYPKLKTMENFNFNKNIYTFFTVDTNRTFMVHFDKKNEEVIFLNRSNLSNYICSNKEIKNYERFFFFIEKEKPDVLLGEGEIFRDTDNNNINYLFMKDNKIFVYRLRNGKIYELNKFIHKFFNEKSFVERAILDEQGLVVTGS